MQRNMLLAIVIVAIIAAIIGLQRLHPQPGAVERNELVPREAGARLDEIKEKASMYPRAVELVEPDGYINTEPFNLSDEIGRKVILVDFWTYSCINCQRTLPYLAAWDAKYRDQGLLIVGVHTPEFEFEKEYGNVKRATEKYGVQYPVVLDNDYRTWSAYENHYWPHHYLIDIDGFIVDDHIGEGGYEETERMIQRSLEERREALGLGMEVTQDLADIPSQDVRAATSEVYLGYGYARDQFGSPEGWQPEKTVLYTAPEEHEHGLFYLQGLWKNNPDSMEAIGEGVVHLRYAAQSVNIVAGSRSPSDIQVFVDGVNTRNVTVSAYDLYPLSTGAFGEHELELHTADAQLYTFTFG